MSTVPTRFTQLAVVLVAVAAIATPNWSSAKGGGAGITIVGEILSVRATGTTIDVKVRGVALIAGLPPRAGSGQGVEVEVDVSNARIELAVPPEGFGAVAVPPDGIESLEFTNEKSFAILSREFNRPRREGMDALLHLLEAHVRDNSRVWLQLRDPEIKFRNGNVAEVRSAVLNITDPDL